MDVLRKGTLCEVRTRCVKEGHAVLRKDTLCEVRTRCVKEGHAVRRKDTLCEIRTRCPKRHQRYYYAKTVVLQFVCNDPDIYVPGLIFVKMA